MAAKFAMLLVAAGLISSVASFRFSCPGLDETGFLPSCCRGINGQVGTGCIGAHQIGADDPYWECNQFVYNITGCCQSIDYKNPATDLSIYLCSTSVGP